MLAESILSAEQADILHGLTNQYKTINPKYFYDQKGSQLFDQITRLIEYYPTAAEISILKKQAAEIAQYIEKEAIIIEPGAGSCEKIQYLLQELEPEYYFPQDVSKEFLEQSAMKLSEKFPWLKVETIVSDFAKPITIPEQLMSKKKYVFYPGSTLGNFEPDAAHQFLKNMRQLVGSDGGILIGVDLHKDTETLEAAYNDQQGITALFNINILTNINKTLNAKINEKEFKHHAFYNLQLRRIEMHLISLSKQDYTIKNTNINFAEGESIHTENSYKYSIEDLKELADRSGFTLVKSWLDDNKLFSVNFLKAK